MWMGEANPIDFGVLDDRLPAPNDSLEGRSDSTRPNSTRLEAPSVGLQWEQREQGTLILLLLQDLQAIFGRTFSLVAPMSTLWWPVNKLQIHVFDRP